MSGNEIDKVLATQLLEATKNVLQDLNRWLMDEASPDASESSREMSQTYGKVRRLRDYLQRSIATYSRSIRIELTEDDTNLLVGCIVHHVGVMELQMESGRVARGDLTWYREKTANLSAWATENATRPVERVPVRDAIQLETASVRGLMATIKSRTSGSPGSPDTPPENWGAIEHHMIGNQPFKPNDAGAAATQPPPETQPAPSTAAPALHPTVASEAVEEVGVGGLFLDPKQIADPRLRTLIAMDLQAFQRTKANSLHRLAMVHLASVFEGVVVDYGLAHAKELSLTGMPESWRIEEVVRRAMTDDLTAADRGQLLQMVAARHLVRPAVQLSSPVVVTGPVLERAIAFTNRVLVGLGYVGSAAATESEEIGEGGESGAFGFPAPTSGLWPSA